MWRKQENVLIMCVLIGRRWLRFLPGLGRLVGFARYLTELVFAYFDARWRISPESRILFLDLGANTGQAFSFFSKVFSRGKVTFELFEPNPHCLETLTAVVQDFRGKAILHQKAVGTGNTSALLYGLAVDEGGPLSQGASLLLEHNSSRYRPSSEQAVRVEVVDLAPFLERRRNQYDLVVVKMDIEGMEIELLNHLVQTQAIEAIDVLYLELHSSYLSETEQKEAVAAEMRITSALRRLGSLRFRAWH